MGRTIYFSDKEMAALRDTAGEWCSMMGDGNEDSVQCVDERLHDGLGSALKKLYKGSNGYRIYKSY